MTNFALSSTGHATLTSVLSWVMAVARGLGTRIQEWRRLRATTRALDRLSDESLRDIGLERDEIRQVYRSRNYQR